MIVLFELVIHKQLHNHTGRGLKVDGLAAFNDFLNPG